MSSILPKTPKVLLDTTVLCGAIRTNGIQRQLLSWARLSTLYEPVISRVCLLEFYRNAANGLGGVAYTFEEIEGFLDLFVYPVLEDHEAVNSLVGRYSAEIIKRRDRRIGDALVEISGITTDEAISIIEQEGMQTSLLHFDEQDVHVWVTAIQQGCDFIVTSNIKRFPEEIGKIKRIKPGDFYNRLTAEFE